MGIRMRELREELGISQEKLAEKSDISKAIILELESGRLEITTISTLNKLIKALGKTMDELFN